MALSRKRFVAYARPVEYFYPPEAVDPTHPLRQVWLEDGALVVRIQPALWCSHAWAQGRAPRTAGVAPCPARRFGREQSLESLLAADGRAVLAAQVEFAPLRTWPEEESQPQKRGA